MTRWPLVRDVILFGFGLSGIVLEAVQWTQGHAPDPTLTAVFVAAAGLPGALRRDERN